MEEFEKVISGNRLVLVDFYAEWCAPCKAMEPELAKLSECLEGTARVFKADVEKYLQEALKYEVRGVPTFILFKEGEVVWKEPGVVPVAELERVVLKHA